LEDIAALKRLRNYDLNTKQRVTYQAITLLGSSTSTSTEEMAALSWFWSKASALMTLWATINFRKFLAIFWSVSPTALFARFVTGAFSFGFSEIINVHKLRVRSSDYFIPVNASYVTEIVIIE